ncbi:MAG TPA: hypothetical protein VK277_00720 [Acidimicrobiales bacterium]|nr:hypothetical protein [Acidimicrobiales bacterium]
MTPARTLRRIVLLALLAAAAGALWVRLSRPASAERHGHGRLRGSFDQWPAVPRAPGARARSA